MKYFLIEIAEGDAKIAGKGMYTYETREKAIASYHKKLGTAMDSDLYAREQILVLNSANGIEEQAVYVRPQPESDPDVYDDILQDDII